MQPVSRLLACLIAAGLLCLAPGFAAASPWVNVTNCDTISIGGNVYPRITFEFRNAYPVLSPEYPFCEALLVPHVPTTPTDTCRVIASSAPGEWQSGVFGDRVFWTVFNGKEPCILPGQSVTGFQIVLSKGHNCCYDLYIYGNLFEPFAQDLVCFNCDLPTSARSGSWGLVKSIYRQ